MNSHATFSLHQLKLISMYIKNKHIELLQNLPWVVHSPSDAIKSTTPLSTLIPGMIPIFFIKEMNDSPEAVFW